MTTAKEFFKKFPKAEVCYVVDGQVFHAGALGSAKDFARNRSCKVVEAFNPAYAPVVDDAPPPAATNATTHEGEGKAKSRSAKDKSGTGDEGDGDSGK